MLQSTSYQHQRAPHISLQFNLYPPCLILFERSPVCSSRSSAYSARSLDSVARSGLLNCAKSCNFQLPFSLTVKRSHYKGHTWASLRCFSHVAMIRVRIVACLDERYSFTMRRLRRT